MTPNDVVIDQVAPEDLVFGRAFLSTVRSDRTPTCTPAKFNQASTNPFLHYKDHKEIQNSASDCRCLAKQNGFDLVTHNRYPEVTNITQLIIDHKQRSSHYQLSQRPNCLQSYLSLHYLRGVC